MNGSGSSLKYLFLQLEQQKCDWLKFNGNIVTFKQQVNK